jgi:demethylmenaquinone methyltransferase/2-methoxy-6-polyprenyl-1,4-benzoquinol methylase
LPKIADRQSKQAAPHPPLTGYYQSEGQRRSFLNKVFNQTATHYDRIDRMMSLGSGPWYRRTALKRAGLAPGMQHLDVAVGTGAVARSAVEIVGETGSVIGLDPSIGMLKQTVAAIRLPVIQGVAERLPFPDGRFDFLSMGYALRHVADLDVTFAEYFRVLKPGGALLILEFARPKSRLGYALGRFYLNKLVPWVSQLGSGSKEARLLMEYCWDTVNNCVPADTILTAMQRAGFEQIKYRTWFGVFSEYRARKPAAGR